MEELEEIYMRDLVRFVVMDGYWDFFCGTATSARRICTAFNANRDSVPWGICSLHGGRSKDRYRQLTANDRHE